MSFFTPPLPPPLPLADWSPLPDDDTPLAAPDWSIRSFVGLDSPAASSSSTTAPATPSFLSLNVIRSCDDNLRRMGRFDCDSVPSAGCDWGLSAAPLERRTAVELLVDKTLGSHAKVNASLVDWIDDPVVKWHVGSCVVNLRRDAIVARDPNAFRLSFDEFLKRIAAHFLLGEDLDKLQGDAIEKNLEGLFLQRSVAATRSFEYLVRRFKWACDGVRVVTDAAMYQDSERLTDDEIRDLCACMRSLTTALPSISQQLEIAKRLTVRFQQAESAGSLTVSASTSRSTTPTVSPVVSPTINKKELQETKLQSVSKAPSSWAKIVTTAPIRPLAIVAPPQSTREMDETLQFFYEAPELDGMKRVQVFRLKRHCTLQPKATLCPEEVSLALDHHQSTCPHSHSLLEVMSYSPLYKLFVCNDDRHYGVDAHERGDCAFLHIDVGFTTEWMDDFAKGKRSYCSSGASCSTKTCLKSHSFAEMCWYNPWYKIQRCERGCTETSLACRFFHEGSGDRRYLELDDDHVGHATEIPFVFRTHDALIKKLKALGL